MTTDVSAHAMIASYATPNVSPRNLGLRFTLDGASGSMLTTGLVVFIAIPHVAPLSCVWVLVADQ